jgi:hypothetical protein
LEVQKLQPIEDGQVIRFLSAKKQATHSDLNLSKLPVVQMQVLRRTILCTRRATEMFPLREVVPLAGCWSEVSARKNRKDLLRVEKAAFLDKS